MTSSSSSSSSSSYRQRRKHGQLLLQIFWKIIMMRLYMIFRKANNTEGKSDSQEVFEHLVLSMEVEAEQEDFGVVEPGSEEDSETDVH